MNTAALTLSDVEKISVNINDIYLDMNNPRFHGESDLILFETENLFDLRNQELIRQYILKKYSASEIVDSILEVGFIPVDLIVVEEFSGKFIVVEGNRRVAALKTIHGNIQRKNTTINDDVLRSINNFEVLRINKNSGNNDLKKWILQGIRHVSGVRGWGPYQQSMLINELHYRHGLNFKDIGRTIGIHYNRVSTMLRAYLALQQMKTFSNYVDRAHANLFSHFEQAYVKKQLRDWLEWDNDIRGYANYKNLFKFYDLIIGNSKVPLIMSKNIRDDLPIIFQRKDVFEDVMNKKMSLEEAKQKVLIKNESSELESTLRKCLKLVIKNSNKLTESDIELILEIKEAANV